jgi:hypothetical protein
MARRLTLGLKLPQTLDSLTAGQLSILANLVFRANAYTPRRTDLEAVVSPYFDGNRQIHLSTATIDRFVEEVCEYLWDHILGEPRKPTVASLFNTVKPGVLLWFKDWPAQKPPEPKLVRKKAKPKKGIIALDFNLMITDEEGDEDLPDATLLVEFKKEPDQTRLKTHICEALRYLRDQLQNDLAFKIKDATLST